MAGCWCDWVGDVTTVSRGGADLPPGPLHGVRVLDFSTVYAAPITAMLLGDYGADVLKVEHPAGDPARTHGFTVNGHGLWWKVIARNKETMTLDVRSSEGREILLRLAADSDVMVENFRPGVLEGWGLGPDELFARNPGLVLLRTTGFGQAGPYARRRAFGSLAEAMTGFAHQTGQPDGPPTLPPFGLADGVTGITGAFAVMTALYHRDRGVGRGQVIDLSLFEPLLGIMGPNPSAFDQLGVVPRRHGNRSINSAPRNTYLTRDGRWVAVSSGATSVAARVMRLVGRPDLAEEPWFASAGERAKRADVLDAAVADWIQARDFEEVYRAFEDAGAALFPVYDVRDLLADPQVQALDSITTIDDEDLGPLRMQNVWFRLHRTPGRVRFGGRRLGQDTDRVLTERLGYTADEIARLREAGVV
jgi:crotonobetainyl-CoA:carnitine CoA-transferase CaiB-like acyl-CoA transferase